MIKLKTLLSEAGKFYKGSIYNDEPFDNFRNDKTSLPKKTRPDWDAFVDKYNSIDGYETKTSSDGLSYDAEIKNIETGLRWVVQGRRGNNWTYIGRTVGYTSNPEMLRGEKELIANFEEINGTSSDINSSSTVITIKNLDDYLHTRLVDWMQTKFSSKYNPGMKWVGGSLMKGVFTLDVANWDTRDLEDLKKYLKSQNINFTGGDIN